MSGQGGEGALQTALVEIGKLHARLEATLEMVGVSHALATSAIMLLAANDPETARKLFFAHRIAAQQSSGSEVSRKVWERVIAELECLIEAGENLRTLDKFGPK